MYIASMNTQVIYSSSPMTTMMSSSSVYVATLLPFGCLILEVIVILKHRIALNEAESILPIQQALLANRWLMVCKSQLS